MNQFLSVIGACITVFILGSLLLFVKTRLLACKRRQRGYNEENIVAELCKTGAAPDIVSALLQELRQWSSKDFPVLADDKLATVYGLSHPEDVGDFIDDFMAKYGYKPINEDALIHFDELVTVKDLALFLSRELSKN